MVEVKINCPELGAPHTTTGVSAAELLMGQQPQSHLDLMRPQVSSRVHANQFRQKMAHDQRTRNRSFELGDTVFIKNFAKCTSYNNQSLQYT